MPAVIPVTVPELITEATAILLLVHDIAPDVVSVNWIDEPAHTIAGPVIAAGLGSTALG